MSDVIETLKNGSEGHTAKLLSDGSLQIGAHAPTTKATLEAFQPYALMAIEAERRGDIEFLMNPISVLCFPLMTVAACMIC
jgi:hypothetical protein